MSQLTSSEFQRYARHLNLPDFGMIGQERLKSSKVLVVGAGGLGSPLLFYLTAAGIGHIGIIDGDIVDRSNLQRQILYTEEDIDQRKVIQAKKRLELLNPDISITIHNTELTADNALAIIENYDIVADGTDNFPTRYLVNDACVLSGKINVYASIYQFEGQLSVFNYPIKDNERGPNYRDLFPTPPEPDLVPDCATGGVLGVMAGIVGTYQALEVIKCCAGIGEPLVGKLLMIDTLTSTTRIIRFRKNLEIEIRELINYEDFCGVGSRNSTEEMSNIKEITVQELKEWRDADKDFQLIDIREQYEIDHVNIGGTHIVLGELMERQEEIEKDKEVVVLCRSGQRSGAAVGILQQQGFDNVYNLKGGINAWAKDIDTSLPTY